jgi:hypothetical protein
MPSVSRSTHKSGMSGSTSTVSDLPLIVMRILAIAFSSQR